MVLLKIVGKEPEGPRGGLMGALEARISPADHGPGD
jgi:hypothetical protein